MYRRVCSTYLQVASLHLKSVTTVEGLGTASDPHPVQERLHKNHGSQCGFCSPGMVMAMSSELRYVDPYPRLNCPVMNVTLQESKGRSSCGHRRGCRVPAGQPLPLHRIPAHPRGFLHLLREETLRQRGGWYGHQRLRRNARSRPRPVEAVLG